MASTAVGCTLTFVLMDAIFTTVLFIHGAHGSTIIAEVVNFNLFSSLLDLWAAVLLRSALLLGACIGVSRNRAEGPRRVARGTSAVVLTCLVMVTYTLAKLLLLTELRPLPQQPWALGLLLWTFASSLGLLLPWRLLGKVAQPARGCSSSSSGPEDAEKLLNADSEEEEPAGGRRPEGEEPAGGRRPEGEARSGATLGRLLAYMRKDGGLLSVAVVFLLISAVCEWPLGPAGRKGSCQTGITAYFNNRQEPGR